MNMNKVLAAGLVAAVFATTTTEAAPCRDGGFYIGVNAGVALTKNKVKPSSKITWVKDSGQKYNGASVTTTDTPDGEIEQVTEETAQTETNAQYAAMKVKKNKAKFIAELILGYDWRINDVMIGVDLTVGNAFGKASFKTKSEMTADRQEDKANARRIFAKMKTQWQIALMPRIGYLITPETEIYLTAGAKLSRYKLETYKAADEDAVGETAASASGITTWYPEANYTKKLRKSCTRFIPVLGAGLRYDITPELFAKLEYNYELPKKIKAHKEAYQDTCQSSFKIRTQAHIIKLGLGYRF